MPSAKTRYLSPLGTTALVIALCGAVYVAMYLLVMG